MKLRVLVAIVASVATALMAFGVPLGWAVSRAFRDDLRLQLVSAALAATPELAESATIVGRPEPPLERQGVRLAFYGADGVLLSGHGPRRGDAVVRAALRGANGLAASAVAVPVSRDDRVVGVVRAEAQPGRLDTRVRRAWLLMAGFGGILMVAVTVLAVALARRLARPVHELAEAARRLEAGDFAVAPAPSGIGEIDTANVALASAARRLEDVLARERALTADVTHQLRTPLTALRIELEAGELRAQGVSVPRALHEVDRLEKTIASILALARDEITERPPISIVAIATSCAGGWRQTAHHQGRTVAATGPIDLPRVRVSATALRQILDVLVDNALTHGRGTVRIEAAAVSGGVQVTVTDAGTERIDAGRIFARRSISARGHGIGLALARSLAEAEGGRLDVVGGAPTTRFALVFLAE